MHESKVIKYANCTAGQRQMKRKPATSESQFTFGRSVGMGVFGSRKLATAAAVISNVQTL